jgi:hypothetical protein
MEVPMLTAAVSGSFHRHMEVITAAVHQLAALSVRVLSPADPRIVAKQGEFLFVASDRVRSVRLVQDRHLDSIRAASFLWLVCPDGYVGQSASLEIGYAIAAGIPMFAVRAPADLTLREYVKVVPSLETAVGEMASRPRSTRPAGILVDPHASVEQAHCLLDRIATTLKDSSGAEEQARRVYRDVAHIRSWLALPAQGAPSSVHLQRDPSS